MAFTNNSKLRPIVVKAIVESTSPEAEKSLAWTQINLLEKRMSQLDADIKYVISERERVRKLCNNLLDNFPEQDDL